MNRLLEIGFEPAGRWVLEGDRLMYELTRHSAQRNILYAFVCDGEVKYVGKTAKALSVRMSGYRSPAKEQQSTNLKNHERIKQLLMAGVEVDIFALPDNGLLHYGTFHLNLAAALEDDIIRALDPEWNGGVKEQPKQLPDDYSEGNTSASPVLGSFEFTLQPTYYRTGFFNVGVSSQQYLGTDGETIELFLGNESRPILGVINRRANTNRTPRIMGGPALREWFHANGSVMDSIRVEVLSLTSIRLIPKGL
jgi:hypothetical protein